MHKLRNRLLLVLLALLAVSASPLHAAIILPPSGTFFSGATVLGDDANGFPVYYLSDFDTFTYDESDASYVYKYDFGWLYNFGGTTDTSDDVYLYDFDTDDVFYTASGLYPYFYSFSLDTYLYYFEGTDPRTFYDFGAETYIVYDSPGQPTPIDSAKPSR